ncbi:hypothetical protein JHK84_050835 [Glycine max]|nr:hypothetical protein JHK84_050835 [Glycine max]
MGDMEDGDAVFGSSVEVDLGSQKPKDGSESDGVRVVRVVSDDGDQGGQSRVTLVRVSVYTISLNIMKLANLAKIRFTQFAQVSIIEWTDNITTLDFAQVTFATTPPPTTLPTSPLTPHYPPLDSRHPRLHPPMAQ